MTCCFIVPNADCDDDVYEYDDGDNDDYDYANAEMESVLLCARCVLMLVV
jgi:phage baseplate assembly protein gpV